MEEKRKDEQQFMEINVIKRDGTKEKFDNDKINKILEWAVKDIHNVNTTDIVMRAKLSITDGVTTNSLHDALIAAAEDLISVEAPN